MRFLAAVLLALVADPAPAQELRPTQPSILYYVVIPLDGATRAQREPAFGFAVQGRRASQSWRLDTRMMKLVDGGVFEAKWLIVGAVAAGAAAAAGSKGKSSSSEDKPSPAAPPPAQRPPCPAKPAC